MITGKFFWKQLVCFFLLLTQASAAELGRDQPARRDGLKLIWSDEFDKAGKPDPTKWSFEEGFVRNHELQWYQKENAKCKDGFLVIEGKRERLKNRLFNPASSSWKRRRRFAEYTSSCLKTRGKFSWQYGVLEVRARMDAQPGMWPAIWTLGNSRRWPACGEVDLFEYYDNKILANACWEDPSDPWQPVWDSSKTPLGEFGDETWSQQFHVWRMLWDEDKIVLKLDDKVLNTIEFEQVADQRRETHPFRQPHYILLNLAIGGNNGGDPSRSRFPSQFVVDYVRVYQREKNDAAR